MHQKQCISLLLSGALFASLCTGCSQTTMEHHFFTDTVTETEINTEVVEQAITPKIEELQKILGDIKLEVFLQSDGAAGYVPGTGMSEEFTNSYIEEYSQNKTVTSKNLKTMIETINNHQFGAGQYVFCCGAPYDELSLRDFMSGTEGAIEQLCVAFQNLKASDADALESLKEKLKKLKEEKNMELYLSLTVQGLHHSKDDKYYIIAQLTTSGGGILAWK